MKHIEKLPISLYFIIYSFIMYSLRSFKF